MAAWIPLLMAAASAYMSKKGADQAAGMSGQASANAENARKQAMATLTPSSIHQSSDWLFPGLLPNPTAPRGQYSGPPTAISAKAHGIRSTVRGARAEGGPVEKQEPYLVGEEGPEVMVPGQDGTIIPNQGMPPGGGMESAMGGMPGMDSPEAGGGEMEQIIMMIVQAVIQAMTEGGQGGMPSEGMGQPDMGMNPMAAMGGPPQGMQNPMEGGMEGEMPIPRAYGGPVRKGRTYQVGERGPETMVPRSTRSSPQGPPAYTPQMGATASRPETMPTVTQPMQYSSVGEGVVDRTSQMIQTPGQLSSVAYERDQEQANQGLNALTQALTGSLTGTGIDPNGPMGQSLTQSAVLSSNKQRNEAARDYSLAQESLGREDIQTAMANYANMLQLVFGLQGMRSTAAGGQAFPQVQPVDTYAPYARGVSALGYGLNDYFKNRGGGGGGGEAQPGTNQSDAWTGKQF